MEIDEKEQELNNIGQEVLKEITKKWKTFILKTEAKYQSHLWAARYWGKINKSILTLLALLGAAATLLALLQNISVFIIAVITAVFTLMVCLYAVLQPAEKKHRHLRSSKDFQNLMMRMVRCKSGIEFEELWQDYNHVVFEEPHLKKRHIFPTNKNTDNIQWTMSPELSRYIETKKQEAKRMVKQYTNRCVGTTSDYICVEQPWTGNATTSRRTNFQLPTRSNNTYQGGYGTPTDAPYDNGYNENYRMATNGGYDQRIVASTTSAAGGGGGGVGNADDAFEVLIAQKSYQEYMEDGKRKKRQVFEHIRRSQSTK